MPWYAETYPTILSRSSLSQKTLWRTPGAILILKWLPWKQFGIARIRRDLFLTKEQRCSCQAVNMPRLYILHFNMGKKTYAYIGTDLFQSQV